MPAPRTIWLCLPVLMLLTGTAWSDLRAGKAAYDAGRFQEAVALWEQAGKQGDLESIYHLGKVYGEGFGVLEDPVRAYAYFSVAAARGHKASLTARQIIKQEMTVDERGAARQLAAEYLQTFFAAPASAGPGPTEPLIVVAGSVRLLRDSDADILKLSNNWLRTNADAMRAFLPANRQWQFVEVYRYPRAEADKQALCDKHSAYALLGTRLGADTDQPNLRREHTLAWFDCRKRAEKVARRQATKQDGGWNVDSTIAEFAQSLRLQN